MSQSEFGRGYATCLRMFANHRARLKTNLDQYATMLRSGTSHPTLFTPDKAVHMWANGATDHLYEMELPIKGVPDTELQVAGFVRERGLDIGHGFQDSSASTPEEAVQLLNAADYLLGALQGRGYEVDTIPNCMKTDRRLGLKPGKGKWNCPEDTVL